MQATQASKACKQAVRSPAERGPSSFSVESNNHNG